VRVGADHHAARERVLLEHDLVDDAGARRPEADAVARRRAPQEVVHLAVRHLRGLHVGRDALVRLDQVVAVHRRRHRRLLAPRRDELEDRHLRGRILHGDAVGPQLEIRGTGLERLLPGVREVAEQHLLRVGERPAEPLAHDLEVLLERGVDVANELGGRLDGRHRVSPEKA
jgi:hypothetical protein